MKTRPLPLALGVLAAAAFSLTPAQAQQGNASQKAYYTAIAAESAGDIDAAKRSYERALQLNPRNAQARYRLGQLKINGAKIVAKAQERKISSVMIPEFRMDQADFSEALKALAMQTEKQENTSHEIDLPHARCRPSRRGGTRGRGATARRSSGSRASSRPSGSRPCTPLSRRGPRACARRP